MLLDLWSFAIILSDILEFVIYWAEHETFTVSFCLASVGFFFIAYFCWRSTDIPVEVPSPPNPPFIITIQGTTLNNGGRRQSLSDVRVLTSSPYITSSSNNSDLGRRSPNTTSSTVETQVQEEPSQGPQDSTEQSPPRQTLGIHGTRSLFFGFLRRRAVTRPILPTRPSLRTRFSQGPNLVVYHRIYHPSQQPVAAAVDPVTISSSDATPNGGGETVSLSSSVTDPVVNSETLPEGQQVVASESTSDNVSTQTQTPQSTQQRSEISSGDSCVIERGYSESDLGLRDLAYGRNDITSDSEENKSEESGLISSPPTMNGNDDVKFTLKFLNDTQKEVKTQFSEKIADFKRRHFQTELSENKIVRLIFNGRVLDNDSKTLRESGIFDQCVVHCLIVTPQPSQQHQQGSGSQSSNQRYGNNRSGPRGPEPGMFFVSFMGIILVFLWFICFNFGQQLFTQSAVVSLSVLTAIFLIGIVAFYLPIHPNIPNPN